MDISENSVSESVNKHIYLEASDGILILNQICDKLKVVIGIERISAHTKTELQGIKGLTVDGK